MTARRVLTLSVFLLVASLTAWGATITITPTPASMPNGAISGAYSQQLTATGGVGTVTWSVSAGALPTGLSLSLTGLISGPLNAAGSFTFTISATTATPDSGSQTYTVNVIGITTATPMPGGDVGVAYSQTLTAAGDVSPDTWTLASTATPPPGLTLNSTGTITGTPTTAGSYTFTVRVTDSTSNTTTGSLTIVITQATISPSTLPGGTVGNTYSQQLSTNPILTGLTWAVQSGALPNGLSLGTTTGVISGQLSPAGAFTFTIAASGASLVATRTYSISISSCSTFPNFDLSAFNSNASVGVPFSSTVGGVCGTPPYTFSLQSTSGAANVFAVSGTGVVTGTPTVAGATTLNVTITDSTFTRNSTTGPVVINVSSNGGLSVTTTSPLTPGVINVPYTNTLAATGGTPSYTWSLNSGTVLPPGLTLSSAGIISGTPTATGTTTFGVTVTDSASPQHTAAASLTIVIGTSTLSITTTSPLTPGVVNVAYTNTLQVAGGTAPYNWIATGLPPVLTLAASTGVLSGTPTAVGTTTFSVTVTDSATPQHTVTGTLTIVISTSTLHVTTTSPLPSGTIGTPYSQVLTATAGTAPYTWSVTSGNLPAGLTLAPITGILSGTPATAGTTPFTVTVTDSATPTAATATAALSITINATPLSITTTSLAPGGVGIPYSKVLQATGGVAPYFWSVSPGSSSVPAGLTLASGGTLSGTPTTAGPVTFFVTVTDSLSTTANASLAVTIYTPTLTVTGVTASCFVATANRLFPDPQITPPPTCPTNNTYQFTATGGTPSYSFAVAVASALPPGLTLSSSGVLSGTPTAAGSYTFTAVATDSLQAIGALNATVVVSTVGQPSSVTITLGGSAGPAIANPQQLQQSVVLSIGNTFQFPVNGKVTVTFASSVGGINSLVTFASGPTATFRISAGAQTANVGPIAIGTQAGTITLTATQFTDDFGNIMTPSATATVSYTVAAGAPVITSVVVSNSTTSGFTLAVTGYSTTRDMTSAQFNFTAASGVTLAGASAGVASATVQLTSAFTTWYTNPQSNAFGSTFQLTIPFTFSSTGTASTTKPVSGVTVTMTNSKGTSATSGSVTP